MAGGEGAPVPVTRRADSHCSLLRHTSGSVIGARCVFFKISKNYKGMLQECSLRSSGRADGQQRTWRLPVTEVTRLRHLGEEEAEKDVERQLITDSHAHV